MENVNTDPQVAEHQIRELLKYIGEDVEREGLQETPKRILKSWTEFFLGYDQDPDEILSKQFSESEGYDEMVVLRNIEYFSYCEHHMVPIVGVVHIGYIPNGKVVGISKLARVVDVFSRRLQIQERMTMQISDAIERNLEPLGVAVIVVGKHFCMSSRGVEKQKTEMVTSRLTGTFRDDKNNSRAEFFSLCGIGG